MAEAAPDRSEQKQQWDTCISAASYDKTTVYL